MRPIYADLDRTMSACQLAYCCVTSVHLVFGVQIKDAVRSKVSLEKNCHGVRKEDATNDSGYLFQGFGDDDQLALVLCEQCQNKQGTLCHSAR